jgi:oxygen-independent coproporphyrinogen-3 oxidase
MVESDLSEIERDYVRWYPARIAAMEADEAWRRPSMGLYVHIPYCAHRCHFCKYKVKVGEDLADEMDEFIEVLTREIRTVRSRGLIAGRPLSVVYIGGGTPSLLTATQLEDLLACIDDSFDRDPDCEFTIECSPASLTAEKLAVMRSGGANRVSVGVQSFDDDRLVDIGRDHAGDQARAALRLAKEAGFGNVNLDLIYRLPSQTVEDVHKSVLDALEWEPTHLSLYPLWIREGTILWARQRAGELEIPGEDVEAEMFAAACDLLASRGYSHYNAFDFVAPGAPRCRYTELQWEDGDWVGVGPSAVTYVEGRHMINAYSVRDYMTQVTQTGSATTAGAHLDTEARMRRTMMFGLRMDPFDTRRFYRQYGVDVYAVFGEHLERLLDEGLLERDGDLLRVTREGVRKVNNIGKLFYRSPEDRQSLGISRRGVALVEIDR